MDLVFSFQWSVVSGQWSVVSGQWSVFSGQLSVFSGGGWGWSLILVRNSRYPVEIWGPAGTLIFAKLLTEQGVGFFPGAVVGLDCRSFAPQSRQLLISLRQFR